MKIRVEPGIFEWTKWEAGRTTPTLMTAEELKEANVNVSTDYRCATQPCPLPGFSWKMEGSLTQGGPLQWGSQEAREMGLTPNMMRTRGDV